MNRVRLALLLLICAPCLSWCEQAAGAVAARPTGVRLVLIGLDGADWQIAGRLIDAGRLPHLAQLRRRGAWGDLRSTTPTLSPLLWTSLATGKTPDQHGIIDFLAVDPGSGRKVPITSSFRRVPALWNIYSAAGRQADFIAWWATWPAERIRGRIVSDRLAYSLFGYESRPEDAAGLTSPPELLASIAPLRVDESSITLEQLRRFASITPSDLEASRRKLAGDPSQAYADPLNHLTRILASTRTYHAIALKLLREPAGAPADLFSVYYQGIDEVGHRFGHFLPPKPAWVDQAGFDRYSQVVDRFYEYQDELIGELVEAAGPGATFVVLSDHGFLNGSDRPDFPPDIELQAGRWHRLYGILLMAGPGIRPGRIETTSLYDVTPTMLYLSGLPVATDMAGRPILDAIEPAFRERHRLETIASYDGLGRPEPSAAASSVMDEEFLARLRSLGYVSGGPSSSPAGEGSEEDPGTLTGRLNLAGVSLQKGDLQGAERTIRSILERRPDHATSRSMLAEVLERQGRPKEALEEARAALNLNEEPPDSLVERFVYLSRRQKSLPDAREYFLRATRLRSGRAEPWFGLGLCQSLSGDFAAAQRSLLRALEINPRSVGAVTGMFNLFERAGRPRELLPALEAALAANPDSAAHHSLLGLIHSRLEQTSRAETELRRALELDPERESAIAALGDVMLQTGRLEEARRMLEGAVARRGDQPEVRMALGRLYSKQSRLGEAARQFAEAARLDPRSASAHAQLGMMLLMQGQEARSVPMLERALELDPEMYELRLHLAVMYHGARRAAECEEQLRLAIEARPRDPEPRKLLASLLEELGRAKEAQEQLEALRSLSAGSESGRIRP